MIKGGLQDYRRLLEAGQWRVRSNMEILRNQR